MRRAWLGFLLLLPFPLPSGQAQPVVSPCVDMFWEPRVEEPFLLLPAENFYEASLYYNATYGRSGCQNVPCFAPSDDIHFEAVPPAPSFATYSFMPNPARLGEPEQDPFNATVTRRAVTTLKISVSAETPPASLTLHRVAGFGCGFDRRVQERWIHNGGDAPVAPTDELPARETPNVQGWLVLGTVAGIAACRYRTR